MGTKGMPLALLCVGLQAFSGAAVADEVAHCTLGETMAEARNHAGAPRVLDVKNERCRGGEADGANCDSDADCPGGECRPSYGAGIDDGRDFCQYRMFVEDIDVCFCERDYFHPGESLNFDSLEEGIAFLADYDVRLFFGPVGEDPVELALTRTPVKRAAAFGTWFTEIGVILKPGVGDYESTFVEFHPDFGPFEARIRVHVLPHASAHDFGAAPSQLDGSVVCPPHDEN